MKIKVQGVKDRGDLDNERVVLKVLADTDIGGYILAIGRNLGVDSFSPKLSRTFWFPDKPVKQGDFVSLYSKVGTPGQFQNKSESDTHTFFLGLDSPIWTETDRAAILFEVADWQAKITAD